MSTQEIATKDSLDFKDRIFDWGKKALYGGLGAALIASASPAPVYAESNKKENVKGPQKEVTVPIGQVVNTGVLEPSEWSQDEVTVPISAVNDEYVKVHFSKKNKPSKSKGPVSNIRDGQYTQEPEITYDQNDAIDVSDFNFQLNYDQGDLKDSKINFTVKNESGNIEDVKLILNGEQQLKPKDGNYDEAVEEFSQTIKGLEEGNLYEGTLEVKGESESDLIKFQVYPREFLNIADDDEINIGAHYCVWYSKPGSNLGADWKGKDKTYFEPKLDKYSSVDEEVIAKHIDWATGHGIDIFMINWWKAPDMNRRVNNFLENPLGDEISYLILWDGLSIDFDGPLYNFSKKEVKESFRNDMEYLVKNFLDDKNYFRINDEPVVYLYEEDRFEDTFSESLEEFTKLNQKINKSGIYWLGDNRKPFNSQDEQREVLGGITDYSPLAHWIRWVNSPGKDWILNKENLKERYLPLARDNYFDSKERGKDYIPTVMPGFNEPDADTPTIRRTPEGFQYEIKKAKEMIDEDIKTIFITSFNEWLEGTQIEPSKEYGFQYLDIIKEELAGYKPKRELKEELDHIEFRYNKVVDPGEPGGRKMSIRPAKLEFYDSQNDWDPEFELDLGGPEDTKYLGRGWSVREKEKGSGRTFRWSGKYGESSIFISKAKDLNYMKLNANAISDVIKAGIYLNDKKIAEIAFQGKGWEEYTIKLK